MLGHEFLREGLLPVPTTLSLLFPKEKTNEPSAILLLETFLVHLGINQSFPFRYSPGR